jgi:RNA polymerase sigma factor (sigma-70 family)
MSGERNRLIEDNMGLVGQVIKDKVHSLGNIGIFTYDDLFQIGCVGLIKAADRYKPGSARFSTYAYVSIRNEIYDALEYATIRRNRELPTDPSEIFHEAALDPAGSYLPDIDSVLYKAQSESSGITQKGIIAIRMLALGYTHREIGERMGASANNVSAWVARARKFLRAKPEISCLSGA